MALAGLGVIVYSATINRRMELHSITGAVGTASDTGSSLVHALVILGLRIYGFMAWLVLNGLRLGVYAVPNP